jgi:hypothetical protein
MQKLDDEARKEVDDYQGFVKEYNAAIRELTGQDSSCITMGRSNACRQTS